MSNGRYETCLLYTSIHGCRTIAPIPLGQACSFHTELVSEAASIAAMEASSEGLRATFSPMIDVSRDPRWGRIMESFGEDPYVNGIMGKAMVDGYQQKADTRIAACLKPVSYTHLDVYKRQTCEPASVSCSPCRSILPCRQVLRVTNIYVLSFCVSSLFLYIFS